MTCPTGTRALLQLCSLSASWITFILFILQLQIIVFVTVSMKVRKKSYCVFWSCRNIHSASCVEQINMCGIIFVSVDFAVLQWFPFSFLCSSVWSCAEWCITAPRNTHEFVCSCWCKSCAGVVHSFVVFRLLMINGTLCYCRAYIWSWIDSERRWLNALISTVLRTSLWNWCINNLIWLLTQYQRDSTIIAAVMHAEPLHCDIFLNNILQMMLAWCFFIFYFFWFISRRCWVQQPAQCVWPCSPRSSVTSWSSCSRIMSE